MKTNASSPRIGLSLFAILLLMIFLAAGIFSPKKTSGTSSDIVFAATERSTNDSEVALNDGSLFIDPSAEDSVAAGSASAHCPTQTVPGHAGECVITADTTLAHTLITDDNTKLNCQGHKLLPTTVGMGAQRSRPEVAIFLNDAKHIQVKNCTIENFDFGVFAINSKLPSHSGNAPAVPTNQISDNTIRARFSAISLLTVDNTEISGNRITFTAKGGRGIFVARDSDWNRIVGNNIATDFSGGQVDAFRMPGTASSNPVVKQGTAITITQIEGGEPTILSAVIERKLFQFTTTDSPDPNKNFSENNRIEDNTITFASGGALDGIVLAVPQDTTVSNNRIAGADFSIRMGGQCDSTKLVKFPGTCSLRPGRKCLADADCKIGGVDTTDGGTCGGTLDKAVCWVTRNTVVDGNEIRKPFNLGIATTGANTRITANKIFGPLVSTGANCAVISPTLRPRGGILLQGKFAVESTTLRQNSVSDIVVAIRLTKVFQGQSSNFASTISQNDFTGYLVAICTSSDYISASELSVGGKGNYWGTPCPTGLAPSKVKKENGAQNSVVTDSHPYGAPVAALSILPLPCH